MFFKVELLFQGLHHIPCQNLPALHSLTDFVVKCKNGALVFTLSSPVATRKIFESARFLSVLFNISFQDQQFCR